MKVKYCIFCSGHNLKVLRGCGGRGGDILGCWVDGGFWGFAESGWWSRWGFSLDGFMEGEERALAGEVLTVWGAGVNWNCDFVRECFLMFFFLYSWIYRCKVYSFFSSFFDLIQSLRWHFTVAATTIWFAYVTQ